MTMPPWEVQHKTTQAWNNLARLLSADSMMKENGDKLYPHGVQGIQVKWCVFDILEGFSSYHKLANFCRGNDDELSDKDDFVCCVEDVCEWYYDWKRDSEMKKASEKQKEMN